MTGWWSLGERAVVAHAWQGWAGVYRLADTPGYPRYIGRSDEDVQKRLLAHAREGRFRYFLVEHIREPDDAFHRECQLFHYYRYQLRNVIHPNRPRGCGDACPKCSQFD